MNKDIWYGEKLATNWYKKMQNIYTKLIVFDNGVNDFQGALKAAFTKSSASGIEF